MSGIVSRRLFLRRAGALLAGTALTQACAPMARPGGVTARRPDIVLVVFDDTGFSDFGCYGSEIRTPAIDALAARGLRYNRFETRAICSPTRAAVLSGRNSHTMRMKDLAASGKPADGTGEGVLAAEAQLLPAVLREAGYATLGVGKWHLAPEWQDGAPGNNDRWPLQRGFDHFYGFLGGWDDQYKPQLIEDNRSLGQPDDPNYHFSEAIVDKAIERVAALDAQQPCFLYLAFGATHAPIQVGQAYIDRYRGIYERGWDAVRAERFERQKRLGIIPADTELAPADPDEVTWASLDDAERKVYARFMAAYAGFLEHADEQLGRLVAALKANRRFDNTVFVVMSDNGPAAEGGDTGAIDRLYPPKPVDPHELANHMDLIGRAKASMQRSWAIASATPFRRYKVWPYLGGVRAPLVVSGPIGANDSGEVRDQAVDDIDIAPTLAELAGASFASTVDGVAQIPLAGRSMAGTFRSSDAASPRGVQYFELRGNRAIRQGDWRAVSVHRKDGDFAEDEWRLFDLSRDFAEAHDLSADRPEKLAELKVLWEREAERFGVFPLDEGPAYMRGVDVYGSEFSGGPSTR